MSSNLCAGSISQGCVWGPWCRTGIACQLWLVPWHSEASAISWRNNSCPSKCEAVWNCELNWYSMSCIVWLHCVGMRWLYNMIYSTVYGWCMPQSVARCWVWWDLRARPLRKNTRIFPRVSTKAPPGKPNDAPQDVDLRWHGTTQNIPKLQIQWKQIL